VHAGLIEKVADTLVAVIGDTVQLNCRTTLTDPIFWGYEPPGSMSMRAVYEAESIVNKLRDRFSLNKTLDRHFILIIRNVSFIDAGKYICIENDDLGPSDGPEERASGELIVIGQYM